MKKSDGRSPFPNTSLFADSWIVPQASPAPSPANLQKHYAERFQSNKNYNTDLKQFSINAKYEVKLLHIESWEQRAYTYLDVLFNQKYDFV